MNRMVPPSSQMTGDPVIEENSYGVYIRIPSGGGFALEDADVARAYARAFAESADLLAAQKARKVRAA